MDSSLKSDRLALAEVAVVLTPPTHHIINGPAERRLICKSAYPSDKHLTIHRAQACKSQITYLHNLMFAARTIAFSKPLLSSSIRRTTALTSQLSPTNTFTYIRTMASIPKTMKGVIMEKNGGTEVLQYKTDLPVPEPKEGQILIKNDYVGINFIDT